MLFHITYEIGPACRGDAQAIFQETGGLPPEGVEKVGRWHCSAGPKGYIVASSNDAEAIALWLQAWTKLMRFDLSPAVEDEQFARVIG
jgi:hypothetical protein